MADLTLNVEKALDKMEGVGEVGTQVSLGIHNAVLAGGEPARHIADALHGKWMGHPLHPVLTDITIGAWVMGGIFDAVGAMTGDSTIKKMGDRLAEAGTISAIPTALSGLADYSTFPEWSATPATLHGAMNIVNIALYGVSIRDRRKGNHTRGVILSTVALGLSCVSAWLGGMLVYKDKVGVDHRDRFEGPKTWKPVLDASELKQRKAKRIEVDGKPVMLYRDDNKVYAIGANMLSCGRPA